MCLFVAPTEPNLVVVGISTAMRVNAIVIGRFGRDDACALLVGLLQRTANPRAKWPRRSELLVNEDLVQKAESCDVEVAPNGIDVEVHWTNRLHCFGSRRANAWATTHGLHDENGHSSKVFGGSAHQKSGLMKSGSNSSHLHRPARSPSSACTRKSWWWRCA